MNGERKYLYGIIADTRPRRFGFGGVEEAEVYTVNHGALAVAVSDAGLNEIDPTRKNVLAHTVVQDKLLRDYTILPMSFGLVVASEDEVRKLLEANYEKVNRELDRLSGKIEAELKILWDRSAIVGQFLKEGQELEQINARLKTAPPVEAQRLLVEAGKKVESIVQEWKRRTEGIYSHLRELAVDARQNQLTGLKYLLYASFLIERSAESQFRGEVYRLDAGCRGRVNFRYVAPLPPYSFVSLTMVKQHAVKPLSL